MRHYVPEFERCWAQFAKPTHSSWRMDETAVSVRGRWNYPYRAVDRNGKSIHSLLCEDRSIHSAHTFFRQAVNVAGSGWPRYPRRVSFGHSLYLLVTPKGGRLWQYRYCLQGREKMLSFGGYPDVSMAKAKARGNAARQLLELGIDPSERRKELRHMPGELV